jgi:hypothetical protein
LPTGGTFLAIVHKKADNLISNTTCSTIYPILATVDHLKDPCRCISHSLQHQIGSSGAIFGVEFFETIAIYYNTTLSSTSKELTCQRAAIEQLNGQKVTSTDRLQENPVKSPISIRSKPFGASTNNKMIK